ncbi:MAG: M20 family metallo-hydrolase [Chloroflexota bacterium]
MTNIRISNQRLLNNLFDLAKIGATADGGVTRLAFSELDIEGRIWFAKLVQASGFDYAIDGAGNQSAILRSKDPEAKTLIVGSHLDTVFNGGRYDGALGVLAAFEAAQTLQESNFELPFHLEIINFTDEEGSILGEFGSHALTGALTETQLENPRGGRDNLIKGLQRLGISETTALGAKRDPADILGFLELHIEQGMRLKEQNLDIGVVTSIVGIRSEWIIFRGKANHAGTTPMDRRQDALWGAADFMLRARDLTKEKYRPAVLTCTQISSGPAAFNIVPEEARFALEFRNGTEVLLDQMAADLSELGGQIAREYDLEFVWDDVSDCVAAPAAERMIVALETAANTLGLTHKRMMSFAGHDTQMMSNFVPSAMFFVPSEDGISHNPKEYTKNQDVINGANVLLHAILSLS